MRFLRFCWVLALAGCSDAESAGPHENVVDGGGQSGGGRSSGGQAAGVAGQGGAASAGRQSGGAAGDAGKSSGVNRGGDAGSTGNAPGGAGSVGGGPAAIECRAQGDGKSTITLVNHCQSPLEFRGSGIEGGTLEPGGHACRDVGDAVTEIPAIRFWGFIGQDPGGERYTLAELTLNTDFNDFDWYNISHVDAHNLPMQVAAFGYEKCRALTCAMSLLAGCPAEGQLKDASGKVISCFSPDRDNPNSAVAKYFEASCADAYSWSGDDQESVVACAGEDYDVIFCP